MEYKILKLAVTDGIMVVTISRPQALNALNSRFFLEMEDLLSTLPNEIRLMVVTGEGKAFVAGADISEMVSKGQAEGEAFSLLGQRIFRKLEQSRIPVIAAVNGHALGGGCELAMACDFRIASTRATFGQPEVSLGLIPGYAGTQRMPRLIGRANALYLLMTGERISAEEALRVGLVQKVVAPEMLLDETLKIARTILANGPVAITLVKQMVQQGLTMDFNKASILEAEKFGTLFHHEGELGMRAFLEKRKPTWELPRAPTDPMNYDDRLKHVSVLGAAGKMGSGILLLTAMEMADRSLKPENKDRSYELYAIDVSTEVLKGLLEYLHGQVRKTAEKKLNVLKTAYAGRPGLVESDSFINQYVADVMAMIKPAASIEAAYKSTLIFEAIKEDPVLKVKIFKQISEHNPNQPWFLTNTSSIPIGRLNQEANLEGRILGVHFYNPPAVQKLVEVIRSEQTPQGIVDFCSLYIKNLGKTIVHSNDYAGFIGNGYFMRDAIYGISETFLLSREMSLVEAIYTINRIGQDYLIRPMGTFQLIDYVGIDVCSYILSVMQPYFPKEELRSPFLDLLIAQGIRGGQNSSGAQKDGIFKYVKGKPIGIWDTNSKTYVPMGSFQAKCDERLGPLPSSHQPWKVLNFSPDKKALLKAYFSDLRKMHTKGSQLARSYLEQSLEIGNLLVTSGVAHDAGDVNTVMITGFYNAYGPINSYLGS